MMFSRAVISLAVFLFLAGSDVCAAQTFTILHSFPTSGVDGWNPTGLVRGPGDALYGTNGFGGPGKVGNVFKITAAGDYSVLHNFSGGADGSLPSAAPIIDLYGDIYGVTEYGGSANSGTIYKIDRHGNYEVLYNFLGGATGANPQTALVRDKAGNLYGATSNGGSSTCGRFDGCGIVFKFDSTGQLTVVYSFTGASDAFFTTSGALVTDQLGNLYGMTNAGGKNSEGAVYKVTPTGMETILLSCDPISGYQPRDGLLRTPAGELYGTTTFSGNLGGGVVFALSETGDFRVVHAFGETTESFSVGGVVQDAAGNLYGTTQQGGDFHEGTIYKIEKNRKESVVYSFTGGADGGFPTNTLVIDPSGNLYGTSTTLPVSAAVIFKFTP